MSGFSTTPSAKEFDCNFVQIVTVIYFLYFSVLGQETASKKLLRS